jgi:nucleoside-diphosphate kinase
LAKKEAIKDWRALLGPTKVFQTIFSHPESIRGQFGLTDTRNAGHGSDSETSALKEIIFFFPEYSSILEDKIPK